MSVTIKVNGTILKTFDSSERGNRYFSYSEIKKNKPTRNELQTKINEERGENKGLLEAIFYGSENAFNGRMPDEPDLDNILLYNMDLSTSIFDIIYLEKKIDSNRTDTLYEYNVKDSSVEDVLQKLGNDYTINAEIDGDSQEERCLGVTIFFYNKFREWLTTSKINTSFGDSPFELVIEYNGHHSLSESSFIKHAVDGTVSAMQKCDFNRIEELKLKHVDPGKPELAILDGENVISIGRNNNVNWHPQDHLISKLVVIKNPRLKHYLRIRVKATA
ncbi:MAG: hypothetical protein II813_09880 [Spirochaetales bacterium]|nr:hypothetical protein [Spirochaetales bacterium]